MKLTEREREILEHRLNVPDCINDAFFDLAEEDEPPSFTEEELAEAINDIQAGLPEIPDDPTEVERAILWDCLDGSTFMQGVDCQREEGSKRTGDYMSFGEWQAYHRAATNLESKIRSLGVDAHLKMI